MNEHTEMENEIEDDHYTQDQRAQGIHRDGVFISMDELAQEAEEEGEEQERHYFKLHKFQKRLEHTWGPEAVESLLQILEQARGEDFWVAEKPRIQIKLERLLNKHGWYEGDIPHIIDQYHKLEAEEQQHYDQLHSPEAFAKEGGKS
jgi:16S rRNA C967 or C1407 C5-methylase (RsmB/RsmF family)